VKAGDSARATPPTDVIEKYEALRMAVLGEGLSPESRNGLALFLRRGMWGWVQATAAPTTPVLSTRSRAAERSISEEHQTVIHLFADLAMRSAKGSSLERFS